MGKRVVNATDDAQMAGNDSPNQDDGQKQNKDNQTSNIQGGDGSPKKNNCNVQWACM